MPPQTSKSPQSTEITLDDGHIEAFRALVRGSLVGQSDPDYDDARAVYNAMHDKHPALIVRATGVASVIAAVNFAREHDLLLAVRGGGHSVSGFGTCDGGSFSISGR